MDKKKKIGIIILNYMEYEVTINCVNSFLNLQRDDVNIKIVIVDNCSRNNSFEILKKEFCMEKIVSVIESNKNMGFANGNNMGYRELLKYMIPDFVICSNSDIIIKQEGLYKWISDAMDKYEFGVLGPSIYSINGKFFQNPIKNKTTNLKSAKQELKNMYWSILKLKLKLIMRYKSAYNIDVDKWDNPYYEKINMELTLHGAFQIFSYKYFEIYEEPYDPGTFLYMEEYILKLRCKIANLKMIYLPDYRVDHLQAFSTNAVQGTTIKKGYFKMKNMIKSMKRYIFILKQIE